ncbi:vitelline membrane outer layer protein 1-like [Penaeus monodon]|uniref:vitelline membrane outer layer protein 1-like n=1 Tax=Penaeus monodon TaxID=6687 RepID=UPI0018A774B5|nr:vitelline membrane outer layer protein 1-like [Penaeus monodon]
MGTDDFGITHLKLFCVYPNASDANDMIVGVNDNNPPGAWEDVQVCPEGKWLKTWMQAVTPSLGSDDDDALNNIVFYCSSDASGRSDVVGQRLLGTGDGRYAQSSTVTCPFSTLPCGVRAKVHAYQASGDDTAVNHVQFACCFIDL